jgi:biotin/methionine sulfoxide reductase
MPRMLTSSHWGVYAVERTDGREPRLTPLPEDPDPSPIGLSMLEAYRRGPRVLRPAVRAGWLDAATGAGTDRRDRGREPFVELPWDQALDLVARELRRVADNHGQESIFAGSYGWASAGRFHHAQSQLRRFMNLVVGGCVQQVDTYSLGAGRVVLPHVAGPLDHILANQTDWHTLAAHTRLFVAFGGVPRKNGQVMPGGPSEHQVQRGIDAMLTSGCRFVNFSVTRSDLEAHSGACEWIPIRPNTDVAVMLALATEIIRAGRHDRAFLASHTAGFARWERYLMGCDDGVPKDAEWAGAISGVDPARLRALALDMADEQDGRRTMVNAAWSLQRADHGEQPFWAVVGLAAVIGQVGLPGGGFGLGYGAANGIGSPHELLGGPTLPFGRNPVRTVIPCARLADMLLRPGQEYDYNGQRYRYPHARLVYWVGGNPFHHHQDLNRLARAWREPETIVVHEQFWNAHAKRADIVLPATATTEREDIGYAHRDPLLVAMRAIDPPPGEARDDHAIFVALAARLGREAVLTEERTPRQWLEHLWSEWRARLATHGADAPQFARFWENGEWRVPETSRPVVLFEAFRADPVAHPLATPTGRIELWSERVASFGYDDCPGHPCWLEPAEWLGGPLAARFPLHLVSDQPHARLHSQLDFSPASRAGKVAGREPLWIHPDDARRRDIRDGDTVRLWNERGACLAGAIVTDALRPGVVKLSTGAWWDPAPPAPSDLVSDAVLQTGSATLCRHGNPNVLTRDVGASQLSQGCAAQTCLVEAERWTGEEFPVRAFDPPTLLKPGDR